MKHVQLIAQSLILVGLLAQATASLAAKPVTVSLLPDESTVVFKVTSKFVDFEGKGGNGVTGTFKISGPKAIEGQATLPVSNLNAGIGMRDRHMKNETLDVAKFPEAKFVPTLLPWEDPSQVLVKDTNGQFEGKLMLRGVEKDVQGKVSTRLVGDKVEYTFVFDVKLPQHSIPIPSFSGVTVNDLVTVTVVTPAKVVVQ